MADEAFGRAEQFFESGSFHKAQQEYDLFCHEFSNDSRVHEAELAAELSKVAQSLDDTSADPHRAIESLDKLSARSRSEPSWKRRWPVVLTMAHRSARALLESANRSLSDATLESGDIWLRWLHEQQAIGAEGADGLELDNLDELSAQGWVAAAAQRRRQDFLDAADRAIADGDTASFAQAFRAYERWGAETKGADSAVQSKFANLQQALLARIRFVPAPAPGETAASVPRLPLEPYTLLATNIRHRAVSRVSDRPVFARAKDLCYAIEPATGAPRWVVRVGYDAPMPQFIHRTGQPAVVLAWFNDEASMIALCDAATGETIWSWESPDPFAGPPAVTGDSVFAATRAGSLWHLDLELGTVRGVAELPEAIDSPPTLREDGRGLCVVGARQAVYLFDIARETPQCSEIVLINRRADTARCQILWVPPYIILFENDLVSRCFARVFFHEAAGHRQVRQVELDGRVWQPPVLDGADILVVTDHWKTHCFGLDPGNSAVNLYTAATPVKEPGELSQPTRPYVARVSEVPFVCLTDALYGYRADRAQGLIREVWTRPLPHAQSRGVQPLQASDGLIVATLQEPESDGTLLQAFSSSQGELLWETRLTPNARDLAVLRVPGSPDQVIARTDSGHVFLITRDQAQQWCTSRMLEIPAPSSKIQPLGTSEELVYSYDAGTAIQVISAKDGSRVGEAIRSQPIASDLAVHEGNLSIHAQTETESRGGQWVLYVTADRSLNCRAVDSRPDDINAMRLPAADADAAEEPWSWAPAISGAGIITAHPRGVVCRTEVRKSDDIVHLALTQHRADLPPLVMAPIPIADVLLCLGQGGQCLAIDAKSLRTRAEWQAPGRIRHAVTDSRQVWLCLEDSTVLDLHYDDASGFESNWQQRLNGSGWSLSRLGQQLVAVHADGLILPLDEASGKPGPLVRLPAAPALAPQLCGEQIVVATVDGGLFFMPD